MILLRHDCLVFKTMDGEMIPCSSEEVTLEIIGDAIGLLDEHVIKEASAGVLHYFREELGKTTVTIAEFAAALQRLTENAALRRRLGEAGRQRTRCAMRWRDKLELVRRVYAEAAGSLPSAACRLALPR